MLLVNRAMMPICDAFLEEYMRREGVICVYAVQCCARSARHILAVRSYIQNKNDVRINISRIFFRVFWRTQGIYIRACNSLSGRGISSKAASSSSTHYSALPNIHTLLSLFAIYSIPVSLEEHIRHIEREFAPDIHNP